MKWLSKLRMTWVLMLVAVVAVGLVGANKIMHGPALPRPAALPARDAADQAAKAAPKAREYVATGIIAPESDIIALIPSVKGEVKEVLVKQDQIVKKGDVLLRMDSQIHRNNLERAINGVKNAELTLEKAKDGMKEWELRVAAQKQLIAVRETQYRQAYELQEQLDEQVKKQVSADSKLRFEQAKLKALEAHQARLAEESALKVIEHKKPTLEIRQAEIGLTEAKLQLKAAEYGVEICELRAPADGTIMQSMVSPGVKFGEQAVKPAFLFYSGGLIVKAEIVQEFAGRVKLDLPAVIHDAAGSGQTWKGKVTYVARSFLPSRRDALELPILQQSGEPVLEFRITLDEGQPTPFLNQKVRVHIGQ